MFLFQDILLRDEIMHLIKNIGFILLAIYLILVAFSILLPQIGIPGILTAVVALVAAVFILLGR